jgi:DNA-directed RNA polymerase subunit beta
MCGRGPWSVSARHGSWQTTAGVSLVHGVRYPEQLPRPQELRKDQQVIEIPNLIDIQKRSTTSSCRRRRRPRSARPIGLQACSRASSRSRTSTRPARSSSSRYNLEKPKYDVDECRARGMTFAAPIKVDDPPRGLGRRRGDRRPVDPRREGAGGLLRRDPAHDRQRARSSSTAPSASSSASCTARRARSSTTTRARATRRASCSTTRASSRTAARGSTSSSTTRTCSTCASTAAASCRDGAPARALGARATQEPHRPQGLHRRAPQLLLRTETRLPGHFETARSSRSRSTTSCWSNQRATRDIKHPKTKEDPGQEEPQVHQGPIRKLEESGVDRLPIDARRALRQGLGQGRDRREHRRGAARVQRGDHRGQDRRAAQRGVEAIDVLFIDNLNVGPYLRDTLLADKIRTPKRRSWRSTAASARVIRRRRDRANLFNNLFFNPSATTCRRSAA